VPELFGCCRVSSATVPNTASFWGSYCLRPSPFPAVDSPPSAFRYRSVRPIVQAGVTSSLSPAPLRVSPDTKSASQRAWRKVALRKSGGAGTWPASSAPGRRGLRPVPRRSSAPDPTASTARTPLSKQKMTLPRAVTRARSQLVRGSPTTSTPPTGRGPGRPPDPMPIAWKPNPTTC